MIQLKKTGQHFLTIRHNHAIHTQRIAYAGGQYKTAYHVAIGYVQPKKVVVQHVTL